MFLQNRLNFDRKKLSCRRLASVFQPSVIARFADLKHAAHRPDMVFVLVFQDKYMPLAGLPLPCLYVQQVEPKKPSASFNMLFASRSSAFSRSSSRLLSSPCGERPSAEPACSNAEIFQSTLPVRGATVSVGREFISKKFQFTLPARGATRGSQK